VTKIGITTFKGCTNLATLILGNTPPAMNFNTYLFQQAAVEPKTITIKAPGLDAYNVSPWTDKMGLNTDVGDYWDTGEATKANLTVALEAL
jgi:hypothetical protein